MKSKQFSLLSLAAIALIISKASADIIISEKFAGSAETDLVGQATTCGNTWTGATAKDDLTGAAASIKPSKFAIRQDGTTGGIAFTAYHKFTLETGRVYTLTAVLSPTNKFDNQWLTVGFCVTDRDGDAAPNLDGGSTYGQTVLSGSGYRYGWPGPDTKDMSELKGPGLHAGPVKVVLDTSNPEDYTIELFDGEGVSIHGPESIGSPAISQVFIGNSGTDGAFREFTLSDDAPEAAVQPEIGAGE